MSHLLRTKIVCTIGPASREPAILDRLILAGMNVARLNFSHGTPELHRENIQRVRLASARLGKPVAILADLQGPKLRVGQMPDAGVPLVAGETLVLTTEPIIGAPGRIPVQYEGLPAAARPEDRILIDDGLIELVVIATEKTDITARVITGGLLISNKGLNLPRADLSIPAITEKDREDLRFALEQGADWIALSFVRTADEVLELKGFIRELAALSHPTPVISKIEKPEAVEQIDAIIAASDGIMVARGDLGIETSPEAVPMIQKAIIRKCRQAGKPVITATQMLDSMIRNPRPTRAEASDVANAILDGSDAIMLSGETATGRYPVESVETMVRIASEVEDSSLAELLCQIEVAPGRTFGEAVAHAAVEMATDLGAAAIVAPTVSGYTARQISRFRPPCPIVAVTPSPMVQRELVLLWGVYPVLSQRASTTDEVVSDAIEAARVNGYASEGDIVVVTGGSVEQGKGTTNLIKLDLVERVLARGTGMGDRRVMGHVRRLSAPLPPGSSVEPDEIVVVSDTDRTFLPVLRRAMGMVAAAGGPEDHARLLAMELGLPAIVGVGEAIECLQEGVQVVVDAKRGVVYERPPALLR